MQNYRTQDLETDRQGRSISRVEAAKSNSSGETASSRTVISVNLYIHEEKQKDFHYVKIKQNECERANRKVGIPYSSDRNASDSFPHRVNRLRIYSDGKAKEIPT